jgi:hypothetical protein
MATSFEILPNPASIRSLAADMSVSSFHRNDMHCVSNKSKWRTSSKCELPCRQARHDVTVSPDRLIDDISVSVKAFLNVEDTSDDGVLGNFSLLGLQMVVSDGRVYLH